MSGVATSQNGYEANDRSLVSTRPVPGTDVRLTVRNGAPGDLLLDLAAKFDKRVEDIDNARGHLDDWGYAERNVRGSATQLSNHASGTAIDLNATRHPLGKRGTFTPKQVAAIHALLAEYDGCIRWGGDYHGRPDEMHFEVVASPAACQRVADKLRSEEDDMPSAKDVVDALLSAKIPNRNPGKGVVGEVSLLGLLSNVERDQDLILQRLKALEESNAALRSELRTYISKEK